MLKNICNHSAILLLSIAVLAGPVAANNPHKSEPVKVDGEKSSNFYNKLLTRENPQSYSVTVQEGQEKSVRIHSKEGVSVRLRLPNGDVKEYASEKYFNLEFHAAGEYVVELNTEVFSQYTLKVAAN